MSSLFLEGLISARDLVKDKGLEALEALISEHETNSIETASLAPEFEIR